MLPLDLVGLTALMDETRGSPEVKIGLVDGPVASGHPDLADANHREIGKNGATCATASSAACLHGTFIAGILTAKRSSAAPAICPNCTLLIRTIFAEKIRGSEQMPSATPQELAEAIIDCVDAGAWVINLSLSLTQPSSRGERALDEALDQAVKQGVIVVAAAGNQGTLGSSAITRHPWVIPVVACNLQGRPMNDSNLGGSIGKRGLMAPGDGVTSLSGEGGALTLGGTSVAAPFVTGAIALLWSRFLAASSAQVKVAATQAAMPRRVSVVPPVLDARAAYQVLSAMLPTMRST
jgi:subtilisin family serine protease